MEEEIRINIISSTGERFSVGLNADLSIHDSKIYLANRSYANWTHHEMKLIYKQEVMKDDPTLRSYGLQSNHTIYAEGHNFMFDITPLNTITGMPDMHMSQLIPASTMMMQTLLSSSLYMKQIIGQNPQLEIIFDSNPQLRAMIQNPEAQVFSRLTSPQMMQDLGNELYQKSFEVASKGCNHKGAVTGSMKHVVGLF